MDISATASQKPILLVLIGQSNALGNNNIPTTEVGWALNHPGESWWWQGGSSYYSGSGTASSTGSTGNEFVQTAILDTDRQRCFVALSAQRRLIEEMGRSCALLHVAEGSTTLFSDWAAPPNNGAKDLFNVLDNEGTQAVAHASFPLASDYHTVFLWIQGESDASSDPQSAAYESRLNDFIDGVEAFDWVQNPTWFIFRLNAANPRTYTSVVRAAQDAVIAARSNCILFDTDGWELTDGDHYASTGYLQQGIQVANEVMTKALGGGAIPVWSPSDLSSLTLWFDENDITGSPVSQWDDQAGVVGSGAYLAQSTGANQPATGTINGLAAVDFTSPSYMIGQKLAGPTNLVLSDVITASAYHVLIVAEVTSVPAGATSTIGYQLPGLVHDTLGYFYPINFRYIDATTVEVRGGHWVGSDVTVSAGNIPALNQPVLLEAWYDGTDFRIQVDGNSPGSGAAGNITNVVNRFDIGRNYTATHYFDGLVGEIIVCNVALSAGDRASARTYLADKYGITI
jgi:hypothetical protein